MIPQPKKVTAELMDEDVRVTIDGGPSVLVPLTMDWAHGLFGPGWTVKQAMMIIASAAVDVEIERGVSGEAP